MSNVSRHMQPHVLRELACVKRSFVLRERAALRSTVGARKAQFAQPLCRAVRPAAAGAPIVEAPPEQRPASRRAVRPSAASAPKRKRARKFGGLRSKGSMLQHAGQQSCFAPALRVRSACAASFLRQGQHRPSTAHAGSGVGSIRRMQRLQAPRSRNHRAVCEQNTVTANPSIERTNNGWRALAVWPAVCGPLFAAHVER
jgi:hypothetical protein